MDAFWAQVAAWLSGSAAVQLTVAAILVVLAFGCDPMRRMLADAGRYRALLNWAHEPDGTVRFRRMLAVPLQQTLATAGAWASVPQAIILRRVALVAGVVPLWAWIIEWSSGGPGILFGEVALPPWPWWARGPLVVGLFGLLVLASRPLLHAHPGSWRARWIAKQSGSASGGSIISQSGMASLRDIVRLVLRVVLFKLILIGVLLIAIGILKQYFPDDGSMAGEPVVVESIVDDALKAEWLKVARVAVLLLTGAAVMIWVVAPLFISFVFSVRSHSNAAAVPIKYTLFIVGIVVTPGLLLIPIIEEHDKLAHGLLVVAFVFLPCLCSAAALFVFRRLAESARSVRERVVGSVFLSAAGFALAVAAITAVGRGAFRLLGEADYLARTTAEPWLGGALASGAVAMALLPGLLMLFVVGMTLLAPGFARMAGPPPPGGRLGHFARAFGLPALIVTVLIFAGGAAIFDLAEAAVDAPGGLMNVLARWGAGLVGG